MTEENGFSLAPVNFFQLSANCLYASPMPWPALTSKYLLPDTSALCAQTHFADVALAWNQEGVAAQASVNAPFHRSSHPDPTRGDSVELFLDTRDVKSSGFNTRFCHHFFFLPEPCEGHMAGELTRFRTEDAHELCDPNELKVKAQFKRASYVIQIFIPAQCLYGYDPDQFDRLGFTYRINRAGGEAQHFSVSADDYQIEQQPSLWSSLRLIK